MEFTDDMISKAAKVAEKHVCDRCLGRQFAKVGTGMTNDVRGAMIREELKAAMLLTGSPDIETLSGKRYVVLGKTGEWIRGM